MNNLAHKIAEALEANNPNGLAYGEDERAVIQKVIDSQITVLTTPIPVSGQILAMEMDALVEGHVYVDLDEAIDNDLEGFLDIVSNRLVGHGLLQDITYRIVGATPEHEIIVYVSGLVDIDDLD